jgi:hypothetical protein
MLNKIKRIFYNFNQNDINEIEEKYKSYNGKHMFEKIEYEYLYKTVYIKKLYKENDIYYFSYTVKKIFNINENNQSLDGVYEDGYYTSSKYYNSEYRKPNIFENVYYLFGYYISDFDYIALDYTMNIRHIYNYQLDNYDIKNIKNDYKYKNKDIDNIIQQLKLKPNNKNKSNDELLKYLIDNYDNLYKLYNILYGQLSYNNMFDVISEFYYDINNFNKKYIINDNNNIYNKESLLNNINNNLLFLNNIVYNLDNKSNFYYTYNDDYNFNKSLYDKYFNINNDIIINKYKYNKQYTDYYKDKIDIIDNKLNNKKMTHVKNEKLNDNKNKKIYNDNVHDNYIDDDNNNNIDYNDNNNDLNDGNLDLFELINKEIIKQNEIYDNNNIKYIDYHQDLGNITENFYNHFFNSSRYKQFLLQKNESDFFETLFGDKFYFYYKPFFTSQMITILDNRPVRLYTLLFDTQYNDDIMFIYHSLFKLYIDPNIKMNYYSSDNNNKFKNKIIKYLLKREFEVFLFNLYTNKEDIFNYIKRIIKNKNKYRKQYYNENYYNTKINYNNN